jgi:SAM-dependent methyltransferase
MEDFRINFHDVGQRPGSWKTSTLKLLGAGQLQLEIDGAMKNSVVELASPLYGLRSVADLRDLPYFDALACLGELSLHCGGIRNSAELLYMAGASGASSILEIGCGTGATTRAMLRAGYDVVAVDPSRRMVAAMVRNCLMHAGKLPEHYSTGAEDLSPIDSGRFDIVLLECVFGFVQDKVAAVAEMHRVLKPGGVIAVTDFHYLNEPPADLSQELSRTFGIRQMLQRGDWERHFSSLQLDAWCEVQMGTGGIDPQSVDLMLSDAKLYEDFPGGALGRSALMWKTPLRRRDGA